LKSLLLALKTTKPWISYMKHSMVCEELATSLFKEFNENSPSSSAQNEPILLILDRRLDPVTPILNQVAK
jgi:hypothetical protein